MLRLAALALLSLPLVMQAQVPAQESAPANDQTSTITVRSSLVLVPALVKTKQGALVYTLQPKDFVLTDDGVPQPLHLEEDTLGQPLALVIVVQVGGSGALRLEQYGDLAAELDAIAANVPHHVAVVDFDGEPQVRQPFTSNMDKVNNVLGSLVEGDKHASILDGISFAVDMLRKQPKEYRRAILLLSETIDHGSKVSLADTLRAVGDTNTAIYSIAFNSTKSDVGKEASKFSSNEPGPEHGCFAKDPNSDKSRTQQNYDCVAMLLPPLRLAKMMASIAINNLKRNVPETVAQLTGGEYFSFKDTKTLKKALITISNHSPNRYMLSFHPQNPHPGFHALQLKVPDYAHLTVEARNGYWVDEDGAPSK